jgi:hypothetical protein
MPTNIPEASIGLFCFCVLGLILVVPILYIQITNICKNTTTHQRFAFKIYSEDDFTGSKTMLINDAEDWGPGSVRNSKSYSYEEQTAFVWYCKTNLANRKKTKVTDTSIHSL